MVDGCLIEELDKMRVLELKLFVIEFNRASQLDRSIAKNTCDFNKSEFRKELVEVCLCLMKKIDDGSLSNKIIRKKIKHISEKYNVSYGQAQKVVNVCLKQYMFLTRNYGVVSELDCPLDSVTMKGYAISNDRMSSVNEFDYKEYQTRFNDDYDLKILKDKTYDEQRIEKFMKE